MEMLIKLIAIMQVINFIGIALILRKSGRVVVKRKDIVRVSKVREEKQPIDISSKVKLYSWLSAENWPLGDTTEPRPKL